MANGRGWKLTQEPAKSGNTIIQKKGLMRGKVK